MAALEDFDYPKPLQDELQAYFEPFRAKHPYVGDEQVKPKAGGPCGVVQLQPVCTRTSGTSRSSLRHGPGPHAPPHTPTFRTLFACSVPPHYYVHPGPRTPPLLRYLDLSTVYGMS